MSPPPFFAMEVGPEMIGSRRRAPAPLAGSSRTLVVVLGLTGAMGVAACRPPSPVTVSGSGGASSGSGGAGSDGSGSGGSASGGTTGSGGSTSTGGTSSGGASSGGASSGGATGSGGLTGMGGDTMDASADDNPDAAVDAGPTCLIARGPATKTTGMKFPFPQNREASRCTYPVGYYNEDVKAATPWKTDTVTSDGAPGGLRVKRPDEPGLDKDSTVSEGIGYGMLHRRLHERPAAVRRAVEVRAEFVDGTRRA